MAEPTVFWVARSEDGELTLFDREPYWVGPERMATGKGSWQIDFDPEEGHEGYDGEVTLWHLLPKESFPELKPGEKLAAALLLEAPTSEGKNG